MSRYCDCITKSRDKIYATCTKGRQERETVRPSGEYPPPIPQAIPLSDYVNMWWDRNYFSCRREGKETRTGKSVRLLSPCLVFIFVFNQRLLIKHLQTRGSSLPTTTFSFEYYYYLTTITTALVRCTTCARRCCELQWASRRCSRNKRI